MEMREEDLGRAREREQEALPVGHGARTHVEEEEVLLVVAYLDEDRPGCLSARKVGVPTSQDRDTDLIRTQLLFPRNERLRVGLAKLTGDGTMRKGQLAAQVGHLGKLIQPFSTHR